MKRLYTIDTLRRIFYLSFLLHFLILSISQSVFAQTIQDTQSPLMVHLPVETGISGQPIPLAVRVADDSEIGQVSIKYKVNEDSTLTSVQMNNSGQTCAIKIRITSDASTVYSGPGSDYNPIKAVSKNDIFEIFEEDKQKGFYHIKVNDHMDGWIRYSDSVPVMAASLYTGDIPVTATQTDKLFYSISAVDIHQNKTTTLPCTIQLIHSNLSNNKSDDPSEQPVDTPKKSKSIFKSPVIIGTVTAIVVGGVVMATNGSNRDKNNNDEPGSISVHGQWQ